MTNTQQYTNFEQAKENCFESFDELQAAYQQFGANTMNAAMYDEFEKSVSITVKVGVNFLGADNNAQIVRQCLTLVHESGADFRGSINDYLELDSQYLTHPLTVGEYINENLFDIYFEFGSRFDQEIWNRYCDAHTASGVPILKNLGEKMNKYL
jgi:hypothetical protein